MKAQKIHITNHEGKLEGIPSINSSSLSNAFCKRMSATEGTVCAGCYACRLSKLRTSLEKALLRNSAALASPLSAADLPVVNSRIARFHSFGELQSKIHAENFAAIARANPGTTFALWSKRPAIVRSISWPGNVVLIYSVPQLDPPPASLVHPPKGFDKLYAVFSKGSGQLPCGHDPATGTDRACLACLRCYQKDNGQVVIRQLQH